MNFSVYFLYETLRQQHRLHKENITWKDLRITASGNQSDCSLHASVQIHILIRVRMSSSRCFCQIWRKSLEVFPRYHVPADGTNRRTTWKHNSSGQANPFINIIISCLQYINDIQLQDSHVTLLNYVFDMTLVFWQNKGACSKPHSLSLSDQPVEVINSFKYLGTYRISQAKLTPSMRKLVS